MSKFRAITVTVGALLIGVPSSLWGAEDKIVVTASRSEQSLSNISSSITVIGNEEIKAKNYPFVSDYLNEVEGINLVKDSELGGNLSIFIRGAAAGQTLVLINGVRINDMTGPDAAFSDGNLPSHLVERIEIVRGPQSSAYGSSALGGVVNIITKKAKGPLTTTAELELGSLGMKKASASVQGEVGKFGYQFGLFGLEAGGYSYADVKGQDGEEEDQLRQWQALADVNFAYSHSGNVRLTAIKDDARYDIDAGAGLDDPNNQSTKQRDIYTLVFTDSYLDKVWRPSLQFSIVDLSRSNSDDTDLVNPQTESDSNYEGQLQSLTFINSFVFARLHLQLGAESVNESAKTAYKSPLFESVFNRKTTETKSLFSAVDFALTDFLSLDGSLRWDRFDIFGDHSTFRIGSKSILFNGTTKIRMSYGSGFKSPSLFQLYSELGSLALRPEISIAGEVSIEQEISERGLLVVTYFKQDFKDLIDFDSNLQTYVNIKRSESKGIESALHIRLTEDLKAAFNFTSIKAIDLETRKQLPRRPKQQASIAISYESNHVQTTVSWQAKSLMEGNDFSEDTLASDNINANIRYRMSSSTHMWVRAENLTDSKRPYLAGYTRKPRSFYAGLQTSL